MQIILPDHFILMLLNQILMVINQLILPALNKIENHPVIFTIAIIAFFLDIFQSEKIKLVKQIYG